MKVRIVLVAAALIGTCLLAPSAIAVADDDTAASDLESALQDATPVTVQNAADEVPDTSSAVAVSVSTDAVDATVPSDPADGISLSAATGSFTVSLPSADVADTASVVGAGTVSYDNHDQSTTVPIVVDDGSVQVNTVIASSAAPSTYRYDIAVAGGGSLTLDDDGAVSIIDAAGDWAGGVAPAWAVDANGATVPTNYSIDGKTLIQTIDLSNPDIAYPVVADPWFGIALIDHTTWANTWQ